MKQITRIGLLLSATALLCSCGEKKNDGAELPSFDHSYVDWCEINDDKEAVSFDASASLAALFEGKADGDRIDLSYQEVVAEENDKHIVAGDFYELLSDGSYGRVINPLPGKTYLSRNASSILSVIENAVDGDLYANSLVYSYNKTIDYGVEGDLDYISGATQDETTTRTKTLKRYSGSKTNSDPFVAGEILYASANASNPFASKSGVYQRYRDGLCAGKEHLIEAYDFSTDSLDYKISNSYSHAGYENALSLFSCETAAEELSSLLFAAKNETDVTALADHDNGLSVAGVFEDDNGLKLKINATVSSVSSSIKSVRSVQIVFSKESIVSFSASSFTRDTASSRYLASEYVSYSLSKDPSIAASDAELIDASGFATKTSEDVSVR